MNSYKVKRQYTMLSTSPLKCAIIKKNEASRSFYALQKLRATTLRRSINLQNATLNKLSCIMRRFNNVNANCMKILDQLEWLTKFYYVLYGFMRTFGTAKFYWEHCFIAWNFFIYFERTYIIFTPVGSRWGRRRLFIVNAQSWNTSRAWK